MNRLLIATMAFLSVAAVATEEDSHTRVFERPLTKEEQRFRALDSDNDRKLSLAEFQADATSQTEFTKLDRDGDGFLSMAEFVSRPIPPTKAPKE